MQAEFIFHNVGQGLFYSGQIKCDDKNFNFVYDCGGINKTPNSRSITLATAIKRYKSYIIDEEIDLLVISHLHADHINGIPTLLNFSKPKIKNVFVPYFTFEERVAILLSYSSTRLTFEQIKFILNPYTYLAENEFVENIFVIVHNDKIERISDNEVDLTELKSQADDYSEIVDEMISSMDKEKLPSDVSVIDSSKIVKIQECWKLAFYADPSKKDKFDSSIASIEINKLKTLSSEKEIKKVLKKLKTLYSSSELNETSLIMLHKSENIMNLNYHCINSFDLLNYYRFFRRDNLSHLHMLTGDFKFTKKTLDNVKNYFGSFLKTDVLLLQVPHHGSKDNWHPDLLSIANQNFTLATIPYGLSNSYGHPAIEVINDIAFQTDSCVLDITEHASLFLTFSD